MNRRMMPTPSRAGEEDRPCTICGEVVWWPHTGPCVCSSCKDKHGPTTTMLSALCRAVESFHGGGHQTHAQHIIAQVPGLSEWWRKRREDDERGERIEKLKAEREKIDEELARLQGHARVIVKP